MPSTATSQALEDKRLGLSEVRRLADSVDESDKRLDIFRQRRKQFIKEFAGPYYGEQDRTQDRTTIWRQPLNLVFSIASTLEPTLAMRKLKSGVSTHDQELRWFTSRLRLALDRGMERAKVSKAVRGAIRGGLFGMGAVMVGQESAGELPFCEPVSLDDYVIDQRARSRQRGAYAFEGHRFRMLYDELMDSGLLDKAGKKIVEQQGKDQWRNETERAERLGRTGTGIGDKGFQPQIELLQLYLPHDGRMVWLPGNLALVQDEYLREFDWYGSDEGPYDVLGFHWLEDNAIPVPLLGIIYDLCLLENKLANKIARQADAQKDIALIDAPSDADAEAIRDAQDGQYVFAPGAQGKMLSFGGANEKGYQAISLVHDFLTRISGNIDLVGGMAAQSKTLGQDEMLMANANIRLNDMRGYVLDLAESVARKFAWFIWEDPKLDMRLTQHLGKAGDLAIRWRPGQRAGKFDDYDIEVSVAGRHSDTPEQKAARMAQWWQTYVEPVMALAAQQGSRLNIDLLVNTAGQLMDIDEIDDLWEEGEPIAAPAVGPVRGTHTPIEGPVAPRLAAGRMPPRPIEAMGQPTGVP